MALFMFSKESERLFVLGLFTEEKLRSIILMLQCDHVYPVITRRGLNPAGSQTPHSRSLTHTHPEGWGRELEG